MPIDLECTIKKKVKINAGGTEGNLKRINIPLVFDENGLDAVKVGEEIELCMDLKNKVVFFSYGTMGAPSNAG